MAPSRRIAGPNSKNRNVLLDAAERLMLDEGYAAVTSRRVAAEAGLKPQLVHYYFRTMDDLFLAVLRRRADAGAERQVAVLASESPLRALWEYSLDPRGTALTVEFIALANHRKEIRAEIARYAERHRADQIAALATVLAREGIDAEAMPAAALSVLFTSLSQVLVMEDALGVSTGHAEALALVDRYLALVESGVRR